MIPFSIERAIAGHPVVDREGYPVKIAGFNGDATTTAQVIGWTQSGMVCGWSRDGKYWVEPEVESEMDLFMADDGREYAECAESEPHDMIGSYEEKRGE